MGWILGIDVPPGRPARETAPRAGPQAAARAAAAGRRARRPGPAPRSHAAAGIRNAERVGPDLAAARRRRREPGDPDHDRGPDRTAARAEGGGLARGRAPDRARDQEPADTDPALRAAPAQEVRRGRRRHGPGGSRGRRLDRAGGRGAEAAGRRVLPFREDARAVAGQGRFPPVGRVGADPLPGPPRDPLGGRAGPVHRGGDAGRGADAPGADQPDRQRGVGDVRRRDDPRQGAVAGGHAAHRGRRQRPGTAGGRPGQDVQPLLLHEEAGNRPGTGHRAQDRDGPPRHHPGRGEPASGRALRDRDPGVAGRAEDGRLGVERILVVDDEPGVRSALEAILSDEGFEVTTAESGEEGLEFLEREPFDAVLLDVWLPGIDGLTTLTRLRERHLDPEVVMISGHGTIDTAVRATKLGAFDFVEKPLSLEKTLLVLRNALRQRQLERRNRQLMEQLARDTEIVGRSAAADALRREVESAAGSDAPVLLYGERGSGRETVARRIHAAGRRAAAPFVEVPCGALDAGAAERALFGEGERPGRVRLAASGTLFLEDVDRLPAGLQRRLAASLALEVQRPSGLRVMASAQPRSTSLEPELRQFLEVLRVEVPSLRERRDDIPMLAERFMHEISREYGRQPRRLGPDSLAALRAHSWPGNMRELSNLMERLLLVSDQDVVALEDLPEDLGGARRPSRGPLRGVREPGRRPRGVRAPLRGPGPGRGGRRPASRGPAPRPQPGRSRTAPGAGDLNRPTCRS